MPPATAGMNNDNSWHSWDTTTVRGDRISYWSDVVVRGVINSQMGRLTEGRFEGQLLSRTVPGGRFVNFRADEHSIRRTASQTRGGDGHIMVGLQCRGEALMEQGSTRVRLQTGQLAIIDSNSPFSLIFPQRVERRLVLLPRAAFKALGADKVLSIPRILTCQAGHAKVARGIVQRLTDTRLYTTDEACGDLVEFLAFTLARCLRPGEASLNAKTEAWARVKVLMHEHLSDQGANPQRIAAAAGVSVRTLHRLFAARERTFSQTLLDMRLDKARAAIALSAARTLTEVAFANGFSDLAHFSKRFRERFGEAPKVARSRARQ